VNGADASPRKIRDFAPGEKVTGFFVVRKKEWKTRKDGTPYLLFELGDASGRISATVWENVQAVGENTGTGDTVKVQGTVMEFNDSRQISIDRIRKTDEKDGVRPKDFLCTGKLNADALFFRLMETVASIEDTHLRNLLERMFSEPHLQSRFKEAPGGKLWHHAYLTGLLEHTLSVISICESLCKSHSGLNRDLLMTGAVLHDVGKVEEYEWERGYIDYTDEGRLWGHISIGARRVEKEIEFAEAAEGFPPELKKRLLHLILSHQGKLEQGSPVLPMTREAVALYYADELDSKLNALSHIIERDGEPGKRWSKFIQLMDRFIYLGEDNSKSKIKDQNEK
jgi:3'-5' exoribonuclease